MDKQLAEKNRNYSFKYKDGMEVEDTNLVGDYNFINDCIHTEITSKYSEFLTDQLTNNEEFLKILNENSIDTKKISREQLRIISFVTASIFGVTIEIRQNIIYLEYVI
jgi:hypothetical protein